jgi:hypothetical protein
MDNPKAFARAVSRTIRNDGGAPPAAPPQTSTGGPDDDRPWWEKWLYNVNERLEMHDAALAASDTIFGVYEARILDLETKIAALEKKPAAKRVEHQRDASGKVLRSIVIDG